jgi:putative membrane protein
MIVSWLFAAVHLLALGLGLGAVWGRAQGFRGVLDVPGLRRVFVADAWWGFAALLWIGTGLVRAFGGLEKGTTYYLQNHLFLTKMGLLVVILILEIAPMVALIRWRIAVARGQQPDTSAARRFAAISVVQAVLVTVMVLLASAMARGLG